MTRDKPKLHCLIATVYGQGHVWGEIRRVRLETVAYIKEEKLPYAVIGPDPDDEIQLATWEREREPLREKT